MFLPIVLICFKPLLTSSKFYDFHTFCYISFQINAIMMKMNATLQITIILSFSYSAHVYDEGMKIPLTEDEEPRGYYFSDIPY